jgi:hypothetical protein
VQAQADLTLIRARWAGTGTNRAGQHGARTGQKLRGAIAQLQRAPHILGPFVVDCDLRRWGLKLAERGGRNGEKRAIVATARKLTVLLHHLWVSGEVYEPLHSSSPTR